MLSISRFVSHGDGTPETRVSEPRSLKNRETVRSGQSSNYSLKAAARRFVSNFEIALRFDHNRNTPCTRSIRYIHEHQPGWRIRAETESYLHHSRAFLSVAFTLILWISASPFLHYPRFSVRPAFTLQSFEGRSWKFIRPKCLSETPNISSRLNFQHVWNFVTSLNVFIIPLQQSHFHSDDWMNRGGAQKAWKNLKPRHCSFINTQLAE